MLLVINTSAGYCLREEPLTEKTKLQLKFILEEVVNFMLNDVFSLAFRKPVRPNELDIYDYPYIVKNPEDLGTIRKRLLSNEYTCTQQCINDLNRMFNNCFVYNAPGTPTCVVGEMLYQKMREKFIILERMTLNDLKNYTPNVYESKSELSLKRERSSNSKSKKPASKKMKVEQSVTDTVRKKRLSKSLKACQSLLKELMSKKNSTWNYIFMEAVNPKEVTDYYQIIKYPMDFGKISTKLEEHEYNSKEEFIADVRLVYKNCYTYNGTENFFGKCADSLEKMFESKMASIPSDDQDIMIVSRSKPISTFVPSSLSVQPPGSTAHNSNQPSSHNSSTSSRSSSFIHSHSKTHNSSSIFTTSPVHQSNLTAPILKSVNSKDLVNNAHSNARPPFIKAEPVSNFQVVQQSIDSLPSVPSVDPARYSKLEKEMQYLMELLSEMDSRMESVSRGFCQLATQINLPLDTLPPTKAVLQYKLNQSQSSNTSMTTIALNDSNVMNSSDCAPNLIANIITDQSCDDKMSQEELEELNQDISRLDEVERVLERFGLDISDDEIDLQSLPYHKVVKLKKYVAKKLKRQEKQQKKEKHRRKEELIALKYTNDSNLQPDYARSLFSMNLDTSANNDAGDSPASGLFSSDVDQTDSKLQNEAAYSRRPSLVKQSPDALFQLVDIDNQPPASLNEQENNFNDWSKSSSPIVKKEASLIHTASGTPSSNCSPATKSNGPTTSVKTSVKSSQSDSSSDSDNDDEEETKPRWGSQLFQSKAFRCNQINNKKQQQEQEQNDEEKKARQKAALMIQKATQRTSQLTEKETANRIAKEKAELAARRLREEACSLETKSPQKLRIKSEQKMECDEKKRADMERRKVEDKKKREEAYRNFAPSPINSHELLCYFENKMDPYLFDLFKI